MTDNKLNKYNNKQKSPPKGTRQHQPLILTDSKGFIKKYATNKSEKELEWLSKGGAKTDDSARYLKRTIARQIINYGNIWLYVWLGTCDLTSKNKDKYISINDEEVIDKLVNEYKGIIATVKKYPGSKVSFLEIPIYSIQKYNKEQGHKDPSVFSEQDETLKELVYKLNGKIRQINKDLGTHSPELSSDLSKTRKYRCGKSRKLKTKKYYNFNLYYDGLHPNLTLGKAWLKKISEQAKRDCWRQPVKGKSKK